MEPSARPCVRTFERFFSQAEIDELICQCSTKYAIPISGHALDTFVTFLHSEINAKIREHAPLIALREPIPEHARPDGTSSPSEDVGDESFTCPKCRHTSHNPNDVREKYCGNCHAFLT